ncbi:integral membrane protein [Roseinatronobacter thiooxidans]|uniref:Integral membrane protein n=1 Tax=Roseinatronobacter thiooxidans TaxID=121821 RepID=A0A2W7QC18_9RHOB|nr:integral membrane protein [Roseinatronobacter thiooxidans]
MVLIVIVLVLRGTGAGAASGQGRISLLPWFMVLFLTLVVLGSVLDLPELLVLKIDSFSRACLTTAIAALGVKTSLRVLGAVGSGHLIIVVIQTVALLAFAMGAVSALGLFEPT